MRKKGWKLRRTLYYIIRIVHCTVVEVPYGDLELNCKKNEWGGLVIFIDVHTTMDVCRANFCKSGNGTTFVFCSAVLLPMSQWVTWYNHVCNSPPRLPGLLLYAIVVSPLHCAQFCHKSPKKCMVFFSMILQPSQSFGNKWAQITL